MGSIFGLVSSLGIILSALVLQLLLSCGAEEESNEIADALLKDDPFSILNLQENSTCLLITDKEYMGLFSGEMNYGDECEPRSGLQPKRKEYCKLFNENGKNCLVPTHLTCDPIIKRCVCSDGHNIIPSIHFQFGNEESQSQTLENGRCFIRPTFPTLDGVDCSPGSFPNKTQDDDHEVSYCACENHEEPDYLNTSNPDWWWCSGSLSKFHGRFEILLVLVILVVFLTASLD